MANDDPILTTIRFIPQHEVVQKYGAILPDNLTTQAMKESEAYNTYYAFATGKAIPKLKYVHQTTKEKTVQELKASSGADEGTSVKPGVPDVPIYGYDDDQISWKSSEEEDDDEVAVNDDEEYDEHDDEEQGDDDEQTNSDNDGDDFVHPKFSTHDKEDKEEDSFDPRVQTPSHIESTDDEDSDEEIQGRDIEMTNAQQTNVQPTQVTEDTHVIITALVNPEDVPVTVIAEPPLLSVTTTPPLPTPLITHLQQTLVPPPTTVPSSSLQDLPNFGSLFGFDHKLKTLENNFSEFYQTNQFIAAVSSIPGIVDAYLANKMHAAVKIAVQLQSERLRDEALQAKMQICQTNLDDNIKKIIKNQVKEQVKAQVSKILPKTEKNANEQLEAEILTRSSNESKTSYAVAANLSELELKKILIDKMESNKSIHISNEQKNLYKALVDSYESDKLILDTYGDIVSFKRCRDDEDKDEEPFAGSNQGSKRRRAEKEPESTNASKEKTSKAFGKSTEGSKSHHKSASESTQAEEPIHTAK
ncbi:hypothetical protein Tco_0341642 [Tanacetum coccineum]